MEAKLNEDFVQNSMMSKKGTSDDNYDYYEAKSSSSALNSAEAKSSSYSLDDLMTGSNSRRESVQVMASNATAIILPSIVNSVCDFFYEDDDLLDEIEQFLAGIGSEFEEFFKRKERGDEPEYELEFFQFFQSYKDIIESKITSLIEERGYSLSTFYTELANKIGEATDVTSGVNISTAIASITTFEAFMEMVEDFVVNGESPIIVPPLVNTEANRLEF